MLTVALSKVQNVEWYIMFGIIKRKSLTRQRRNCRDLCLGPQLFATHYRPERSDLTDSISTDWYTAGNRTHNDHRQVKFTRPFISIQSCKTPSEMVRSVLLNYWLYIQSLGRFRSLERALSSRRTASISIIIVHLVHNLKWGWARSSGQNKLVNFSASLPKSAISYWIHIVFHLIFPFPCMCPL